MEYRHSIWIGFKFLMDYIYNALASYLCKLLHQKVIGLFHARRYSHLSARVISHITSSPCSSVKLPHPCLLQFTRATVNLSFSSAEGYIICSSWYQWIPRNLLDSKKKKTSKLKRKNSLWSKREVLIYWWWCSYKNFRTPVFTQQKRLLK